MYSGKSVHGDVCSKHEYVDEAVDGLRWLLCDCMFFLPAHCCVCRGVCLMGECVDTQRLGL